MLLLLRAPVRYLVGKLRSCELHSLAKRKKKCIGVWSVVFSTLSSALTTVHPQNCFSFGKNEALYPLNNNSPFTPHSPHPTIRLPVSMNLISLSTSHEQHHTVFVLWGPAYLTQPNCSKVHPGCSLVFWPSPATAVPRVAPL